MPKIKLFIATSLDGFIAKENGSIDWLQELPNPDQIDYGYNQFLKDIDVVVMGRRTYDDILSFGVDWPYANCKTFVVTQDKKYNVSTKNTEIIHTIDETIIAELKNKSKKNIWIVGGGKLIKHFLRNYAIDEMLLSIFPVLLGKGIRLFQDDIPESKLTLINVENFETGIVNLSYQRK